MAGLPDYLMMGFAVAGIYIGVKYGPQIINNLKQNQANPPAQAQQPTDSSTSTEGPSTDISSTAPVSTPIAGSTRHHHIACGPGMMITHDGRCVPNDDLPAHPNDTKTYPKSTQRKAAAAPPLSLHDQGINVQPQNAGAIHPSNGPHVAPTTSNEPKKTHSHVPKHHPGPCPDGSYPDANNNCPPSHNIPGLIDEKQAYLGYFDYYSVSDVGPQWKKTIPYYEHIASVGMSQPIRQGRVRRALAANNHNFMPGGFVLSEASVRRGVNNVYSAGT